MKYYILVSITLAIFDVSLTNNVHRIIDDDEQCRYLPDLSFNSEKDIIFSLYTRENVNAPQNITIGNIGSLIFSNYILHKPMKIFIHGVCGMPDIVRRNHYITLFLDTPETNFIMVDWDKGSDGTLSLVSEIVPDIGKRIAKFIDWLVLCGVRLRDIQLFGSSMGSHVAGYAGRNVKSGKVPYIFVCDPPRALFRNETERVSYKDGEYVEVVHTNMNHYGIPEPMGHADFYPNGGVLMTGCKGSDFCSHMKACLYLVESLGHRNFMADQCMNFEEIVHGNCSKIGRNYLGGIFPKNGTGIYYLETFEKPPFYKG